VDITREDYLAFEMVELERAYARAVTPSEKMEMLLAENVTPGL
jgi:hypothetical protein